LIALPAVLHCAPLHLVSWCQFPKQTRSASIQNRLKSSQGRPYRVGLVDVARDIVDFDGTIRQGGEKEQRQGPIVPPHFRDLWCARCLRDDLDAKAAGVAFGKRGEGGTLFRRKPETNGRLAVFHEVCLWLQRFGPHSRVKQEGSA